MTASPDTRLVALLGDPVAHSLSPRFQNAAFRVARCDGVYLALRCDAVALPGLLRGIAAAGGAGNVTVPHKELAARTIDRGTAAVRATGACNTFWYDQGETWGDNTDVAGFATAVRALLGRDAAGARVLLIGAGGAARAVLASLRADRAAEVVVLNRTPQRARALAAQFATATFRIRVAAALDELRGETFDLAVNATSLGLRDADPLPLDGGAELRLGAALDLVYRPGETAWVHRLRSEGIPAQDGLEMLLQQGAAAFERWWRVPAPITAMRAAADPLRDSVHGPPARG